jgi:hypothetical protein
MGSLAPATLPTMVQIGQVRSLSQKSRVMIFIPATYLHMYYDVLFRLPLLSTLDSESRIHSWVLALLAKKEHGAGSALGDLPCLKPAALSAVLTSRQRSSSGSSSENPPSERQPNLTWRDDMRR